MTLLVTQWHSRSASLAASNSIGPLRPTAPVPVAPRPEPVRATARPIRSPAREGAAAVPQDHSASPADDSDTSPRPTTSRPFRTGHNSRKPHALDIKVRVALLCGGLDEGWMDKLGKVQIDREGIQKRDGTAGLTLLQPRRLGRLYRLSYMSTIFGRWPSVEMPAASISLLMASIVRASGCRVRSA